LHRLTSEELRALRALDREPVHHLELSSKERAVVRRLWSNRLVRLRSFDTWEIAPKGRILLDAGGTIQ
jgi:hypothetical protein